MLTPKYFDNTKPVKKAAKAAVFAGIPMIILTAVLEMVKSGQLPLNIEAWAENWPYLLVVAGAGILGALENILKHSDKPAAPRNPFS